MDTCGFGTRVWFDLAVTRRAVSVLSPFDFCFFFCFFAFLRSSVEVALFYEEHSQWVFFLVEVFSEREITRQEYANGNRGGVSI